MEQDQQIQNVLERIDGHQVVGSLLELASYGGEPDPAAPYGVATNRLALTAEDKAAREKFVAQSMTDAGMDIIYDHPLAIVGAYEGHNPNLSPVVVMSHTDTVPHGDIYDGTLGVLGGIEAARAMKAEGLRGARDMYVVCVTIEESSRFDFALAGSRSLFHGLTEEELNSRKAGDQSIRQALGEADAKRVMTPVFGPLGNVLRAPYAVVELHVEQDKKLIDSETDLGVVERIAAPERYHARVGETALQPDRSEYAHERFLKLTVLGHADHSGATPMGLTHRADGLVETVGILNPLLDEQPALSIGGIEVYKPAMNKVPGITESILRIASDNAQAVLDCEQALKDILRERIADHRASASRFDGDSFKLDLIEKDEAGNFFKSPEFVARQKVAFGLVKRVNEAASENAWENVVGTVSELTLSDSGLYTLGVDIRGIDLVSRDRTVEEVKHTNPEVVFGEVLAGSGDSPVTLDPGLVDKALDAINDFEIGSSMRMFSAAGHDTQNAARAGIPAVMLFCQSVEGIAHNPKAYTSPENIGKGVRALAALVIRLANEV